MRLELSFLSAALLLLQHASAHDEHQQANPESQFNEPIPAEFEGSWQKWHMKVEHELDSADSASVFKIHDTTNTDVLHPQDILRMYGLTRSEIVGKGDGMGQHDDSELVSDKLKARIIEKVMGLMDTDKDGTISLEEWMTYSSKGGEFPDFGLGPGHEYDFEEEYEKHHWLKYHAESDPDVLVQHAEDIEHELLHHFHEIEHENNEEGGEVKKHNTRYPIRLEKIPSIFKAN
ncbi:hypothetical protein CANARDRAFT_219172 [[Candida] arabinofermentans NRRL YB-2248]|uniref:EF-hand domain-containing protein n=1 Tax=[Candida] arabinofermentans NRRL YB-2248 TaxID=983967 RepID=A0A1E4T385_9ASCO|nr:hypothetical protein CANARDRAFT_219172 [[Candida] arabinofermentans NRRL YB-2248]